MAEPVKIDKVMQGEPAGYAVILDRISQDIPFYRALFKKCRTYRNGCYQQPILVECRRKVFQ